MNDQLVVVRLPLHDRANRDARIDVAPGEESLEGVGDFERAGDADDLDLGSDRLRAGDRARDHPVRDLRVEARGDNCETHGHFTRIGPASANPSR